MNKEKTVYARNADGQLIPMRVPGFQAAYQGQMPRLAMPFDQYSDYVTFILFDTLRFQAGFPISTRDLTLFAVPTGQQASVANNSSTRYTKLKIDTNLQHPHQLPAGKDMIITSIQVDVLSVAGIGTVAGTNENVTHDIELGGPSGGATNLPRVTSVTQLIKHIQDTMWLSNSFGSDKAYEEGLIKFFPTEFGVNGFAGGAAQPPDAVNNAGLGAASTNLLYEAAVQNGYGRPRALATPRYIKAGEHFESVIQPNVPFVPNKDFQLRVLFAGYLRRQVQ